jgi:hypothetical protein
MTQQDFFYPITQSSFWLDNYWLVTWTLSMVFLGAAWAVLFRFGNFRYGLDLGCFLKTGAVLAATTFSLGAPTVYNTNYQARHGHEGDKIVLDSTTIRYEPRSGNAKTFKLTEIFTVYREPVVFNPPPTYYVVALIDSVRFDSIGIKNDLPQFEALMTALNRTTNGKVKKN